MSCNGADLSSMEDSTKLLAKMECLQPGFNGYFKTNCIILKMRRVFSQDFIC